MDELERQISTLKAQRDVARHELAELNSLIDEIRAAIEKPGDEQKIIAWLVSRLQHSNTSHYSPVQSLNNPNPINSASR